MFNSNDDSVILMYYKWHHNDNLPFQIDILMLNALTFSDENDNHSG